MKFIVMAALMAAELLTVVAASAGSDGTHPPTRADDDAGRRPFSLLDQDGNRLSGEDFRAR